MAKLVLRAGDGSTTEKDLDRLGSVTIGRSPECDLPIEDVQASRRHCTVVKLRSGYEVTDLGSTNGTLVNEQPIKKRKLMHGDRIKIGATEIAFEDPAHAGAVEEQLKYCALVHARGDRKGERVALSAQRTTFGRHASNTVVLDDAVASSYHCEVVRDLNGYTIRDLGSTNGTLVNGEMITEAPLTHGARVRVGNARFVFQDPAMEEINLELAGIEDDEPEWGMLREMDLAAVRRGRPATIVYTVLFLLILGGGGFLMLTRKDQQVAAGPKSPAGNKHEPYSFESELDRFTWQEEPLGSRAITIDTTTARAASGKRALVLRSRADRAEALYKLEDLPAQERRLQVQARLASAGGAAARIGVRWSGGGLTRWALCRPVSSSAFEAVDETFDAPVWAGSVRLGVVVEGPGQVFLDDVVFRVRGPSRLQSVVQNNFNVTVTDGRVVELYHTRAPALVHGRLFAWSAAGSPLAGAELGAACEEVDADHIKLSFSVKGAEAAWVGVEFQESGSYLRRGFRAFGTGDEGGDFFVESLPSDLSRPWERRGVRRLLLGGPGKEMVVEGEAGDASLRTAARRDGAALLWSMAGPVRDGAFAVTMKTGLVEDKRRASREIDKVKALHQRGQWGRFRLRAREVLARYPFADEGRKKQLRDRMAEVTREFEALERRAHEALREYESFRDLASLDEVRDALAAMQQKFELDPDRPGWGKRFGQIRQEEAERRQQAEGTRQGKQAADLALVADFHLGEGQPYSAALYYAYVVSALDRSPQAPAAREELEKIMKSSPHLAVLSKILPGSLRRPGE